MTTFHADAARKHVKKMFYYEFSVTTTTTTTTTSICMTAATRVNTIIFYERNYRGRAADHSVYIYISFT
ncbi:unnamed protein product [Trichogramma brassicae]|uniref:Uncharacterized protein n=1 Tax=Trichogramma brassicae TaxID=86971 RepID=A0A6H5I552_9HYME|nr:unnamed protein product [Trichogramma brassicae]